MLILPDASEKSRRLLDQAIADRFRITMLVLGDGSGEDVIASKADIRAQALASARQVVWVRDLRLLSAPESNSWIPQAGVVVCVLNLDDRPVVWLTGAEAKRITNLEIAFLKAQSAA